MSKTEIIKEAQKLSKSDIKKLLQTETKVARDRSFTNAEIALAYGQHGVRGGAKILGISKGTMQFLVNRTKKEEGLK